VLTWQYVMEVGITVYVTEWNVCSEWVRLMLFWNEFFLFVISLIRLWMWWWLVPSCNLMCNCFMSLVDDFHIW
jgi:hypothetical protein